MTEKEKFESKDELEAWLERRGIDKNDVGEAAEKLFAKRFNKPSRLLGITIQELKDHSGIEGPVARELSNKLKDQQNGELRHQKPPATPRFRGDDGLGPPSLGKLPKEESAPKGSPSSDEGIAEGLSRIAAAPSMRVSSNSVSIEFVGDLHEITQRDEVEDKFNIAANYVYKNWHHPRFTAGKIGVYKNER
jgi:NAD-dependent DNA ligase